MSTPGEESSTAGPRGSGRRRGIASALVAVVLYGGWAFAANVGHGTARALRAAATQSLSSFLATVAVAWVMERLFRIPRRRYARVALATAGALATSMALTITLHTLAGTPELLRTVAPVLTLGGLFCLGYSLNLLRLTEPAPA